MYQPRFIYTHFFTASHIVVTDEEPGIILPGLYMNTVTGCAEDIELYCSFFQMNDILHCEGDGPDEVTEQLADLVANDVDMPFTLDVTETGGLQCDSLLYCMEQLPVNGEGDNSSAIGSVYHLRAAIKKDPRLNLGTDTVPAGKQKKLSYYLLVLSVQYDFYLHFINEKLPEELALYYSGLEDPLIFQLAKSEYFLRNEPEN